MIQLLQFSKHLASSFFHTEKETAIVIILLTNVLYLKIVFQVRQGLNPCSRLHCFGVTLVVACGGVGRIVCQLHLGQGSLTFFPHASFPMYECVNLSMPIFKDTGDYYS